MRFRISLRKRWRPTAAGSPKPTSLRWFPKKDPRPYWCGGGGLLVCAPADLEPAWRYVAALQGAKTRRRAYFTETLFLGATCSLRFNRSFRSLIFSAFTSSESSSRCAMRPLARRRNSGARGLWARAPTTEAEVFSVGGSMREALIAHLFRSVIVERIGRSRRE